MTIYSISNIVDIYCALNTVVVVVVVAWIKWKKNIFFTEEKQYRSVTWLFRAPNICEKIYDLMVLNLQ